MNKNTLNLFYIKMIPKNAENFFNQNGIIYFLNFKFLGLKI